uniref:Uncharacterized protein n=1 Tax=Sphaerodactylus townsendi TaxID=933632 RepID=A0ACB8G0N3_9SAUR
MFYQQHACHCILRADMPIVCHLAGTEQPYVTVMLRRPSCHLQPHSSFVKTDLSSVLVSHMLTKHICVPSGMTNIAMLNSTERSQQSPPFLDCFLGGVQKWGLLCFIDQAGGSQ